jgi:uncharacterized protein YdhG (YjbR/CyaY superfamily)
MGIAPSSKCWTTLAFLIGHLHGVKVVDLSEMNAIDRHLAKFSGEQLESLSHLRETIHSIVPQAEECMSYGMPAFSINGKVVAGFDGFKKHCSYFPHSGSVLEEIESFPEWCEVSKGTLKFPIGKKLPKSLVRKLISVRRRELL